MRRFRRGWLLSAGLLSLAACQPVPPPQPEAARYPPNLYGVGGDGGAIMLAEWAFADTARIRNDPVDAAKAVASVDYLAGALADGPRWVSLSLQAKQQTQLARFELRRVLGIAQNAPSQLVVDSLMQAALALQANNPTLAMAFLAPPAFTLPPPQTLQILANLPFLPAANQATLTVGQQLDSPNGGAKAP